MSKLIDNLVTEYEKTRDYDANQSHKFRLTGVGTLTNTSLAIITITVNPCANLDDRKAKEILDEFLYTT